MSHSVIIKDAAKLYGDFVAVNHVNIDIKEGEFFTLLGPSGCGKTTLLRMIAGFNTVDSGKIYFDSKCINDTPAHKRDIGMVFQNYAIFPHLTVEENIAYGLKARKVTKEEQNKRVCEAMEMVQIAALKNRKPNELSGGQQQRVALARAFVIQPTVLLMDEPLSNLDAKLRVQMRTTIKKLQKELGITTIYVTHDQEEALAISDRIAVMKDGNIMQIGTPSEIYEKPCNAFVASFIGTSNLLKCEVVKNDGCFSAKIGDTSICEFEMEAPFEGAAIVSVRPEHLRFSNEGLRGEIALSTFLGDFVQYEVKLDTGNTVILNEYTKDISEIKNMGDTVWIKLKEKRAVVYRADDVSF